MVGEGLEQKQHVKIVVVVVAVVVVLTLSGFLIFQKEETKTEWEGSFEGDYAFHCVEGTFLPTGNLFVVLKNGVYYSIDYKYTGASANGTFENTSKEEINSLLEYVEFWGTNYSITKADKGRIINQTQLFSNQTQINSSMELNESYSYSQVLDASHTIIGIKNKE